MQSEVESVPGRLDPSPLGTREYWDDIYSKDISTLSQTPDHTGQVWFDESGAEDRTIAFLGDHDLGLDSTTATVLDLGTGNASMLLRLRDEGWEGELWGTDYSEPSVRLARRLAVAWDLRRRGITFESIGDEFDSEAQPVLGIHIVQHDILSPWPPPDMNNTAPMQFDLVLDKGTFDAISLSANAEEACSAYRRSVETLVRPGGVLVITSCNWTEEELEKWISGGDSNFWQAGRISYPRFKFGGQEGGVLTGLAYYRDE